MATMETTPVGQRLELRPSPGKGLGLFAVEDLEPGTLIIIEKPLLEIEHSTDFKDPRIYRELDEAVNALSSKRKEKFMELTESRRPIFNSQAMKIFKNNCVGFHNENGDAREGIYLNVSRINHSCIPNATYSFKENSELHMRNTHPLKKGDEITVQYSAFYAMMTAKERAAHLKEHYDFACKCRACQGDEFSKASDRRRKEIASTLERLETAQMPNAASSVLSQAENSEEANSQIENAPPIKPDEILPLMRKMKEYAARIAELKEEEGLTGVSLLDDYKAAIESARSVALLQANQPNFQPMDLAKDYVELRRNTEKWLKCATVCLGLKRAKEMDEEKEYSQSLDVMNGILKKVRDGIDVNWAKENNIDLTYEPVFASG